MVSVFPVPVAPSRVWCRSPRASPSVSSAMARGWSPAGAKGDTSSKGMGSCGWTANGNGGFGRVPPLRSGPGFARGRQRYDCCQPRRATFRKGNGTAVPRCSRRLGPPGANPSRNCATAFLMAPRTRFRWARFSTSTTNSPRMPRSSALMSALLMLVLVVEIALAMSANRPRRSVPSIPRRTRKRSAPAPSHSISTRRSGWSRSCRMLGQSMRCTETPRPRVT
jgi:hypothetical protein